MISDMATFNVPLCGNTPGIGKVFHPNIASIAHSLIMIGVGRYRQKMLVEEEDNVINPAYCYI